MNKKAGRDFSPVYRFHILEEEGTASKYNYVGIVPECSTILRKADQAHGESRSQSCMSDLHQNLLQLFPNNTPHRHEQHIFTTTTQIIFCTVHLSGFYCSIFLRGKLRKGQSKGNVMNVCPSLQLTLVCNWYSSSPVNDSREKTWQELMPLHWAPPLRPSARLFFPCSGCRLHESHPKKQTNRMDG